MGKFLTNLSHPLNPKMLLFTDASWLSMDSAVGVGLVIMSTNKHFSHGVLTESSHEAEFITMESALSITVELRPGIDHIFTDCDDPQDAIRNDCEPDNWRIHNRVNNVRNLLIHNLKNMIEVVPRNWNLLANHFATQGRLSPEISLFHKGRDLLRCLMSLWQTTGFCFDVF